MEWEKLLPLETQVPREAEPEYFAQYPINDLEKDYKAIISSVEFRRLQDKTQVFPLDKSDFVRTRLTHSIEVATIARQLGIMVTQNDYKYIPNVFKDMEKEIVERIPSALSCAGLLHDLGNPPFGHFGEVVIGSWFSHEFQKDSFVFNGKKIDEMLNGQMKKDLVHFEGNAQALRILSKIANKDESHEINLTKGVISALVKYPTDSIHFTGKDDKDIRKHKLGYFYAEKQSFEEISKAVGTWRAADDVARHPLAFLMEAADDIAYATADLEDAYKKKLFTLKEFIEFFESEMGGDNKDKEEKLIADLKDRIARSGKSQEDLLVAFQNWMEFVRKWFMYCTAYSFSHNYNGIMDGTFADELLDGTFHGGSIQILKKVMKKFVYGNAEIVKLELAAKKIISSLLDDFVYAVINLEKEEKQTQEYKKLYSLIPDNLKEDYRKARTGDEGYNLYLRFLMVTDFISGMTDSYAKNLYQDLNGI